MWMILKVFSECVKTLLLFYVTEFWPPRGVWDLAPQPGIEPAHPALEGRVSTTGPPGKPQQKGFKTQVAAPPPGF